ncbi:MAG: NAD+ synthase [Desulforhopalus sp.]|nr:NAD+ synthase [Desulforhopalus sp.]
MKIGLVQINPVIGDFEKNCDKIKSWSGQAKTRGCDLVIFPELAVSGYPPQDLLERKSFLAAHDAAISKLLSELPDLDVMFGCFESREGTKGKDLFNSAMVARRGKIIFRARKQLLPSYDVFDETRYFEPGPPSELYELKDLKFGVTVCEDVWSEEVTEYDAEPVDQLMSGARENQEKIHGIINISASPFQRNKEEIRKSIFQKISRRYSVPFLYCNQIGGQDSLLFDGRSLVMDKTGSVVAQALGFAEDMIVVDSRTWRGDMNGAPQISEQAAVYRGLVMGVTDYVQKCHFSSVVLGLSGGIDSALTAAIAVDALGPENVLGVALPSPYSSQDSLDDAKKLAENLGCRFEVLPITELFACFHHSLEPFFAGLDEDVTEQNLQARIRGNLLMALSNKFNHLLLTTGNKSEMAVGYCTLYGDMSGGLAVISDVPKQLVYELATYINRSREIIPARIITKAPTAELKPDQTDQDDLPPYEILDQVLELHLEEGAGSSEIVARGFDEQMVGDILRRVRINEYKRKQAPMGLKVTTKAFGFGRRYPNVQNFQG